MPAFVLGGTMAAITVRMARSSMLEVIRQDYVDSLDAASYETHGPRRTRAGGDASTTWAETCSVAWCMGGLMLLLVAAPGYPT